MTLARRDFLSGTAALAVSTTVPVQAATGADTAVRPGALSEAQMREALAPAPHYRARPDAPAIAHAEAVERLFGGRLTPLMAATGTPGRFAGAPLTCPPTASTGFVRMKPAATSAVWRNPQATENIFCYDGRIELRYGAALERRLVLEKFDMVSIPAGVRHGLSNVGEGESTAVMVLSVPAGGTYDAVFEPAAGLPAQAIEALGVRFAAAADGEGAAQDDEVERRVTRFAKLVPYKKDLSRTGGLPPEATEALSAGSVFTLIVPEGHVGRSRTAPIYGNQGLYMSLAECRSGDDAPPAHAHSDTQESFFILDGTFEVYTGFDNESAVSVGPGDLISIPPQLMRTFRNTSGRPARLLAIIQGPDRMKDFVSYSRRTGADFARRFGPEAVAYYENIGMTFDAEERVAR